MAIQQTINVLKSYVVLLGECGDSSGAEAVRALASALSAAGEAKIKTTITKIQKVWKQSPELAATLKELDGRLPALQVLLAAGGAKSASSEVQLLVELLRDRQSVSPSEFERLLRSAIQAPASTRPARATRREPLSTDEIRRWADRLTATTTEQAAFEAELSAVLSIPKLSAPELKSIAERYLGYEPPKGKTAILKKLRTRQMQDAMEAGRQSRLQRIAV